MLQGKQPVKLSISYGPIKVELDSPGPRLIPTIESLGLHDMTIDTLQALSRQIREISDMIQSELRTRERSEGSGSGLGLG